MKIETGFNNSICSILVLIGETKIAGLENSKFIPDCVFTSVYELYKAIS